MFSTNVLLDFKTIAKFKRNRLARHRALFQAGEFTRAKIIHSVHSPHTTEGRR